MVIWSNLARADLQSIQDFIAHDSKHYAKKIIQDVAAITASAALLTASATPSSKPKNACPLASLTKHANAVSPHWRGRGFRTTGYQPAPRRGMVPPSGNRFQNWPYRLIATLGIGQLQLYNTAICKFVTKLDRPDCWPARNKGKPLCRLACHPHTLCEQAGWSEDVRAYNELVSTWHGLS